MIWDSHFALTGLMLYPQYLELRFNKLTRQLITATFIMNTCLMLPIFMFIPSLAFSQGLLHTLILQKFRNYRSCFSLSVTGMNIHLINTVVCSICVFYTMLGGIKAVVWTDVVQGGIMLFSVILVGVLGTSQTGGLTTVIDKASAGGRLQLE